MKMRKAVIGSALGLGMGAMAFTGMGTASAEAGVAFSSNGGDSIGFGDNTATGATAHSTEGNNALAVNTGGEASAHAIAAGKGNNVVAIDGVSITGEGTESNNVVTVGGVSSVSGNSARNNVVTVAGATVVHNAHDNTIINAGGFTTAVNQDEDAPGVLSVNVCGTQLSGQADHVTVSPGAC